jgi:prepilin-type N-terminal cleavage/methylation domain-containing protein
MKKTTKAAFTLVELLVVISIIGLLSSVVLASLNSARVKARDARRQADMKELQKAVEFYYDKYNAYPNNDTTAGGDWSAAYKAQVTEFIPRAPLDPLVNNSSRYYGSYRMTWASDANCNGKYVLWAYLENGGSKTTCGWPDNHFFIVLGPY